MSHASSPLSQGNKSNKSPVSLDLCLRKTWSGKSHEYRGVIIFEKLRLKNVLLVNTLTPKDGVFQLLLFGAFSKGSVFETDKWKRHALPLSNFYGTAWTLPQWDLMKDVVYFLGSLWYYLLICLPIQIWTSMTCQPYGNVTAFVINLALRE